MAHKRGLGRCDEARFARARALVGERVGDEPVGRRGAVARRPPAVEQPAVDRVAPSGAVCGERRPRRAVDEEVVESVYQAINASLVTPLLNGYKYNSKTLYRPKVKSEKELLRAAERRAGILACSGTAHFYASFYRFLYFSHFYEVPNNDYRV